MSPFPELLTPDAEAPLLDDARSIALHLLTVVMRGDGSLDHLLERHLQSDLPDGDKRALYDICVGVYRWLAKLDWVLNGFYHGEYLKCLPQMKNALRIALYEIMYSPDDTEDAIAFAAEYIAGLKGEQSAELAANILAHIAHSIEHIRYPERKEDFFRYASVVGSHPWWIAKRWVERAGQDEGLKMLIANNEPAPVTLRINPLRVEREAMFELMRSRGIVFSPVPFADCCVTLDTLPTFAHLETYRKGWFSQYTVSDALAVALMDPRPGETVLSICTGTSGKTLHVAERMRNAGSIVAVDRFDVKSSNTMHEAARLGITNMSTVTVYPLAIEGPMADRVLVDAPNSSLGDAARHPAVKWKLSPEQLHGLQGHQLMLLMHAAPFVKPGGVLLYATHSTEPEENEIVVRRFLEAMPRFTIEGPGANVPPEFMTIEGFLRTAPHRHHIEGSFAVRLKRRPDVA